MKAGFGIEKAELVVVGLGRSKKRGRNSNIVCQLKVLVWSLVASDLEIRAEVAMAETDRDFLSLRFLVSVDLEGSDRELAIKRF